MKYFKCGDCDQVVDQKHASNHQKDKLKYLFSVEDENIINDPDKHKKSKEEKFHEERIEDLENKGRKAQDEEKDKMPIEKRLEEIAKALKNLFSQDLDDDQLTELEELQATFDEIVKIQDELDQLKEDEKKDSKHASKYNSSEFIGYDSTYKKSNYSVLNYEPYHDNRTSGDQLLIRLGSSDDSSTGNSSADSLFKKLGSSD